MFEAFLSCMILSFSVSFFESKNESKNYGWFQEDYWEQNDINSMDWNHPLRESMDRSDQFDGRSLEIRNEENVKGRYFPNDKKQVIPPIEEEQQNDIKEEPLIAGVN